METQHVFNVQLVVKGMNRERVEDAVMVRLNKWLCENIEPPYETGDLLHWFLRPE